MCPEDEKMRICQAKTRKGRQCPIEATYLSDDGRGWCHVHANRKVCTHVRRAAEPIAPPKPAEDYEATHRALFFQRGAWAIVEALGWEYVRALRFVEEKADDIHRRADVRDAAAVRLAATSLASEVA